MFRLPESVVYNNQKYKILTPNGYENFLGVNKIIKDSYIHLKFSNGKELKCSEDHPITTINGIIKAKDIDKRTEIETIDKQGCFIISKKRIKKKIELFDIVNSGKDHLYYSNDILSHNCDFLGSTNTLVSGEKLACLAYKQIIKEYMGALIYEEPIKEDYDDEGKLITKDHIYTILVDISEGKNLDYSAFSVIDISVMPYRQVAIYRNNSIPPILFPTIIKALGDYYHTAFVLIEINNNPQVADIMVEELGYENVFRVKTGNKKAQQISLEWGKNTATGVKMTPLVKRIGCAMLKTLIETDKLIINDFETISELTTFVQEGPSYKAEEGCNDDLAMSLVLFGWLSTQKIFKDILEHNLRKQLQLENFDFSDDDDILPIIESTNGKEIPHFIEDNSVWVPTNYQHQDIYNELFNFYFKESESRGIF